MSERSSNGHGVLLVCTVSDGPVIKLSWERIQVVELCVYVMFMAFMYIFVEK